jgi:hypothetical protein
MSLLRLFFNKDRQKLIDGSALFVDQTRRSRNGDRLPTSKSIMEPTTPEAKRFRQFPQALPRPKINPQPRKTM